MPVTAPSTTEGGALEQQSCSVASTGYSSVPQHALTGEAEKPGPRERSRDSNVPRGKRMGKQATQASVACESFTCCNRWAIGVE